MTAVAAMGSVETRDAGARSDFPGESLEALLQKGRLELPFALRVAHALAGALVPLHAARVIHRDIKPAHILVTPEGNAAFIDGLRASSGHGATPDWAYLAPEQTGRMNRSVDERADLYSLGVVLYRMLTGELPFHAADPLEWVHCHIARTPRAPSDVCAAVPPVVSDLVLKLLAKLAEDRYQSAQGLAFDLRECIDRLDAHGTIEPFALAGRDVSERLQIPQRLYGRTSEFAALLAAFDRMAATHKPAWVLVTGYSGIGKTSLVQELHKPIVPLRGNFIAGKFDQQQRDIPYATLTRAFRDLAQQILSESEERIGQWRQQLQHALGVNGQLIVDVIPAVALVIGPQSPVPELAPAEAQNRFRTVFRQFIGVFTRPEHPLVLFLDDLQWADAASLALLKDLVTQPEIHSLLLVGAYRDNEVAPGHPLTATLAEAAQLGADITSVVLGPLAPAHLRDLVADTLRCSPLEATALAELLYEKTGGNPFFAIQFLAALHEERLIMFDARERAWRWDIEKIRAKSFTDNVVELMVGKLRRLPPGTQAALQHLACFGNSAERTLLALGRGISEEQTQADLLEATRAGLLLRLDGAYKFHHDRIQEAAYSLIPDTGRAATHLEIGRRLFAQQQPEETEKRLFDVVNQLNRGVALITDAAERRTLCRLNFLAGRKAKAAIAYAAAANYFAQSAALLPAAAWDVQYDDTLALYLEHGECEYLIGRFAEADQIFDAVLAHARSMTDQSRVYSMRVRLYQLSGKFHDALAAALEGLTLFGVNFPAGDDEVRALFAAEQREIEVNLRGRSVAELIDAPEATDPEVRALLSLLVYSFSCAYQVRPALFPLFVLKAMNVSLRHGNAAESCIAYGGYSRLLVTLLGDIARGFEFSEMSLRLNEKFNDARSKGMLLFLHAAFIRYWHKPMQSCAPLLEQAFAACRDVGNLLYASFSLGQLIWMHLDRGMPLAHVRKLSAQYLDFHRRAHNEPMYHVLRLIEQFASALGGGTRGLTVFDDESFDEAASLAVLTAARFNTGVAYHRILKMMAEYAAGDYAAALASAREGAAVLRQVEALPIEATFRFYHALTLAAQYPEDLSAARDEFETALAAEAQKLALWAQSCPENFEHRYALVVAERARIAGQDLEAMRAYEHAIRSARTHGFIQIEALANEVAARFYRARGFDTSAGAYLRAARDAYARWGADAKVRALDKVLAKVLDQALAADPAQSTQVAAPLPSASAPSSVEQLDALAIAKASQAISGPIVLDQLLDTLMRVVLEHAGAHRACLLLARKERLTPVADASVEHERIDVKTRGDGSPLQASLPTSILAYVRRTRDKVILADATQPGPFAADEHLHLTKPKSVLCLPIVRQAELIGLLYLENTLVTHAFTPDRLAILELLAAQAAISLDNAQLYADLERENSERRRAEEGARQAEEKYRSIFENAVEGIFQTTPAGAFLTANPALARMLGFDTPAELMAKRTDLGSHGQCAWAVPIWSTRATPDWPARISTKSAIKSATRSAI
jgi:predicted ATPase/GAF domain-containing protein